MDCEKTGSLIRGLRYEKGMTQKQLADRMNISDRTVSKWERGQGCPDIELLHGAAAAYQSAGAVCNAGVSRQRRTRQRICRGNAGS